MKLLSSKVKLNIGIQNCFTRFVITVFEVYTNIILLVYNRIKCLFILYGNVLTNEIRKFC